MSIHTVKKLDSSSTYTSRSTCQDHDLAFKALGQLVVQGQMSHADCTTGLCYWDNASRFSQEKVNFSSVPGRKYATQKHYINSPQPHATRTRFVVGFVGKLVRVGIYRATVLTLPRNRSEPRFRSVFARFVHAGTGTAV